MSSSAASALAETVPLSRRGARGRLWAGRILTGLAAAFLLLDGVMKLAMPPSVVQASAQLGYPLTVVPILGVALLVCTGLYLYRRTSVLGALFLTGYLGGAVASQVRIEAPLISTVFPILFAVLIWAGACLREDRLRTLFPLLRQSRDT